MSKSLLARYQVDNVPLGLRPVFYLYGYGVGILLFLVLLVLRIAIRVQITGQENLGAHSNHIFCLWHSSVPFALLSLVPSVTKILDRGSYAFMQHPNWYMKPIHVLLRLMGVDTIILGSTGHSGREAANQLVEHLRKGCSTVLNPDGPQGPAFILKKGIIHISLQSRVPIVALQFSASRSFELNTWDRKKLPYPFSTVRMRIGYPIQITSDNLNEAHNRITAALG